MMIFGRDPKRLESQPDVRLRSNLGVVKILQHSGTMFLEENRR